MATHNFLVPLFCGPKGNSFVNFLQNVKENDASIPEKPIHKHSSYRTNYCLHLHRIEWPDDILNWYSQSSLGHSRLEKEEVR